MADTNIIGLAQLTKNLRGLEDRFGKVQRKAVAAGGKVILKEMRKRARKHQKTRRLQKGLKQITSGKGKEAVSKIGPLKRAFHALFLEFGTVHQRAQPFIRPAYLAKKDDAFTKVGEEMGNGLKRMTFRV